MSVKPSRTDSLSSCARASVAIADPAKVGKISAGAEPSRPDLMHVAFPVKFAEIGDSKIEGFMERCYYCKKRIAQNTEVFMYGDFGAFCSQECRYYQIAWDQLAMKRR